ncbi:MAG: hypothetical protein AB1489_38355 [Acidobacteriota bacterium]
MLGEGWEEISQRIAKLYDESQELQKQLQESLAQSNNIIGPMDDPPFPQLLNREKEIAMIISRCKADPLFYKELKTQLRELRGLPH